MKSEFMVVLNSTDLNGVAPEMIQLVPFGVFDTPRHGRLVVDEESLASIMADRAKRKNDDAIDYEHQSFAEPPVQAPASGWIKRFENRGKDGIWGFVEWTENARKLITAKEYRYFSPVTLTRKKDGKVLSILGGGLTNTPNIDGMEPLINRHSPLSFPLAGEGGVRGQIQKEERGMKNLFSLLGLAETATEDEVIAAVNKITADRTAIVANKAVRDALGVAETATESEVTGTILAMKQAHSSQGSLASTVADLQARLKARDDADTELLVNSAIAGDGKGAKLLPAQKDWALAYAKRDLEGFKVFLNKAPYAVVTGRIAPEQTGGDNPSLDETQVQVNKMLGISAETWKKHNQAA